MKYSKLLFLSLIYNCDSFILPKINKKINIKMKSLSKNPSEIIQELGRQGNPPGEPWSYSTYLNHLQAHDIDGVSLVTNDNSLTSALVLDKLPANSVSELSSSNVHVVNTNPILFQNIISQLEKNHIPFDFIDATSRGIFSGIPLVFQFIGLYFIGSFILQAIFYVLQSNSGGPMNSQFRNPMQILMNNDNEINTENIEETFEDVAGCDEAKFELEEIVDFLKSPLKYEAAGATIPRGVLLEGPPGTGKTLLAKAVAGEAGVNFFSASGSQFVEMFVGVGASRVRDLFKKANENSPCVIFIDEIDAVGRQRGTGIAGGNDEREQTLNQILTNMDGFDRSTGIIVLAATNRADILDNALTRPGRFDRKIMVGLPDVEGRRKIMDVHFKNKQLKNETLLDQLSVLTGGFSGADIANLANEAAILSVRYNQTSINEKSLLNAYEKVTIGLPKEKETRSDNTIKMVASHEIGHALITLLFKDMFDLQKITIISNKNGAGGYTLFTPNKEYENFPTKRFMLANLMIALGGRAAEKIIFENNYKSYDNNKPYQDINIFKDIPDLDITTGASNDLKQANSIARRYISLFGLGKNIGIYDSSDTSQPFLGRELTSGGNKLSEYSKTEIDKEIIDLVQYAYQMSLNIIENNRKDFNKLVDLLIEKKTVSNQDIENNQIYIIY